MKTWMLSLIGVLFLGTACNSYTPKDQGDSGQIAAGTTQPDFAMVQTKIMQPYCVMCHSSSSGNAGGVNLENYANVKTFIDRIQDSVIVKGTMPPGHPIPRALQDALTTWIANGAPETVSNPQPEPVPTATPLPSSPEDLQPTFSSISKNIFTPKCVMCHGPGGAAENLPVTDYNFLLKTMWVVPNDLGQSSLYDSVKSGRMPPGQPLTQTEIDTIGTWITDGAKNN